MNCYCYFERINSLADPIIELWKESWSKHGWNPIVLGARDFLDWVDGPTYDARIYNLPTINNPIYERACYRRWGVMANIGGGIMLDYDVMNYGFTPDDVRYIPEKCLMLDQNSPCAVVGDQIAFLSACRTFMDYQVKETDLAGRFPHVSDMTISNSVRVSPESEIASCFVWSKPAMCCEFGDSGWETSPLVHFAHYSVKGKSKLETIKSAQR
jgi:hypothetical protein